ncbi:hypothetical protein Bhyg_11467 [Pseudolycoriella hygida]|uniref:Uncharacterized protein n=1 Tax=Pseudolycoriella hygida TaxID=35572 RepID=A0A9Q0MWD6_9DIPT|nr:hypothetical protein Bhyg_11467 [Pseudolycoriella hygida]
MTSIIQNWYGFGHCGLGLNGGVVGMFIGFPNLPPCCLLVNAYAFDTIHRKSRVDRENACVKEGNHV